MMTLTKGEMLDLICDHLPVFEVNIGTGKINWATHALETLFGYKIAGDLEGHPIEILVPEALRSQHEQHRQEFAANPETRLMGRQLKLFGRKRDGQNFPVEVMLLPRTVNRARVVIGIVLDVTGRAAS